MSSLSRRKQKAVKITGGKVSYRAVGVIEADIEEGHCSAFGTDPRNVWRYAPPAEALVPQGGAWCMVRTELPPMERDLHVDVSVGRVFWCDHISDACDEEGFLPDGSYKVLARTPFGEPHLFPHEYRVVGVPLLLELVQAGGMFFKPMEKSEHEMNDVLFYCMSRGIPRVEAMAMALGSVTGPVGWFDPHPGLVQTLHSFMNVGQLTEVNHARRRAAQERSKQK